MVDRVPGSGRYAHPEREQRWTVSELPPNAERSAEILDRYILATRLRLRLVDNGQDVVFKLTQKVRTIEADPEVVMITNAYLSRDEYDVVATLPAAEIRKTRWRTSWNDRGLVTDQFHGSLEGLLLAETELEPDEARLPLPPFAVRDVTNDGRFAGGALATTSDAEIPELLRNAAATDGA